MSLLKKLFDKIKTFLQKTFNFNKKTDESIARDELRSAALRYFHTTTYKAPEGTDCTVKLPPKKRRPNKKKATKKRYKKV